MDFIANCKTQYAICCLDKIYTVKNIVSAYLQLSKLFPMNWSNKSHYNFSKHIFYHNNNYGQSCKIKKNTLK